LYDILLSFVDPLKKHTFVILPSTHVLPCISCIQASLTCSDYSKFKLKSIFAVAPANPNIIAPFESGQKWLKIKEAIGVRFLKPMPSYGTENQNYIQAALVICGLFICDFAYMRSRNGLFSRTYPLINSQPGSFYMRIHYMRVYFWSPYLSHITRSTCIKTTGLSKSLMHTVL